MRRILLVLLVCVACLGVVTFETAYANESAKIGIRGGVGTDIGGGLAYGVGGNYLIDLLGNSLELGVMLFAGSFEEESTEGIHTYMEKSDIFVFAMMVNYLINYTPNESGLFFVVGTGLGSINVEWEERSPTDESLGILLPGGGSMQSAEGYGGGTIFNLGIGRTFQNGLDIRAELPVIVTFSPPGESKSVVPTFTISVGYRF